MIPPHGAALPAPPSSLRQSQRQGLDGILLRVQGPVGRLRGVGYSNTVVSHPLPQMMSQLSCACGVGFLIFHSASHIAGWRGAGGTVTGEICSLKEEDRVLTCTHRPCMTCPHHLPVFTSSLSPQPEGPPPCFSSPSGTLHRLFSLPTESSSPSTFFTPSSLCSNVTFLTRPFLASLF